MSDTPRNDSGATPRSPQFQSVLDYINSAPELLSLLYDLDLMPEQLDFPSHDGNRMILVATWHRQKLAELNEARSNIGQMGTEIIALKQELNEARAALESSHRFNDQLMANLNEIRIATEYLDDGKGPNTATALAIKAATLLAAAQKEIETLKRNRERLDEIESAILRTGPRLQFHELTSGPFEGQMTLTMYNGRHTVHHTDTSLRGVIDAAISQKSTT